MVRIHVPVRAETLAAMLTGDAAAADGDPVLAVMLAVIREGGVLGDFGLYTGVVEIAPGWESFRSGPDAAPTLGSAGEASLSSTVILTTYAVCGPDDPALLAMVGRLLAAHPWEVPVIEVSPTRLAWRG
ncbi:hypothetical protein PMI02_01226 [Novosphingobium sp. AP12]|nr:hypothetical protein PMI02_01226 [Novosphingobium sp. AP12]